ncbi:MAG TPA: hypothetical protein VF507_01060, partial [Pyrinomonadaceae bacterium]
MRKSARQLVPAWARIDRLSSTLSAAKVDFARRAGHSSGFTILAGALIMTNADVFSLPPREAIGLWQNKQIDGAALMRCLVSYGRWMIPVSEAAVGEMLQEGTASRVMFSKDAEGVSRLLIFSDGDAYNEYRKAAGAPGEQHFLSTKGTWVFRLPAGGIDFVAIDP